MYDCGNHSCHHDGKYRHHCNCYGCNWYAANNNRGYSGRGSSGGGSSAAMFLIALVICGIIGTFNEVLGALILIIAGGCYTIEQMKFQFHFPNLHTLITLEFALISDFPKTS